MTDPFEVLGVARSLDLDAVELETLWIRKSREVHPDHLGDLPADEQTRALGRAAELNDAYRALRDRWQRVEALCEVLEPGVLERTKTLPPAFLMEAMETAEEAADVDPGSDAARALDARLAAAETAWFDEIRDACASGDAERAAIALHKSRYDRKALADLRARADDA